jgi:hypothetical protein
VFGSRKSRDSDLAAIFQCALFCGSDELDIHLLKAKANKKSGVINGTSSIQPP